MKQFPDDSRHPARRDHPMSRRSFIKLGIAAAAALSAPVALAAGKGSPLAEKSLAFYNTHTGESLETVFWAEGRYLEQALSEINRILRDPRNDEIHDIDSRLLELLFAIQNRIDAPQPFHVISGYRSPTSNAFLRGRSSGVAKNSLHLVGRAIDIRCPGRELRILQQAAVALKAGGVGYYPKSDFVHVDTGRVRYW